MAGSIRRVTSRLKFWLVYALAYAESFLVILQYGFVPYDSAANGYLQITQHILGYVTYFIMVWLLLFDTVRIVGTVAMTGWFSLTVGSLCVLFALLIWEYGGGDGEFNCFSGPWILIRINMIVTSICLVIVGIFVSFKFQEVIPTLKEPFKSNARKTNIKIWVILSPAVFGALTEGLMDIYVFGRQPDTCYDVFESNVANAIWSFVLRIVGVNAWIWPILYTFNARDPVKFQDLSPEDFDDSKF